MARESVHAKLERVRSPRVHVTYNVEIGDAIEMKEIPFVMGIMADLSGQPAEPLAKIVDCLVEAGGQFAKRRDSFFRLLGLDQREVFLLQLVKP